ncbi:MAG: hypothetical protein HKL99_09765 [Burkholderiales bacterium]|jgi:porphobilinogen deaminase|nr:hypothetical protein [Burkholderiales bacterium]
MALELAFARLFGTPEHHGTPACVPATPAETLAWTPGTPGTPQISNVQATNDAHDLDEVQSERAAIQHFDGGIDAPIAELLARHGDASAGGVGWALTKLVADVQASRHWLVVTPLGCTTLTCTAPTTRTEIMQSLRYSTALPIGDAP